jgi:hypothetical protein
MPAPQYDQNRASVPSPPSATISPQPQQTKPATNSQPWAYAAPASGNFKQPRYIPSKFYLTVDLLAKAVSAVSLLGLLIVMAMLLAEARKTRNEISRLSQPYGESSSQPFHIRVASSSFDPMFMEVVQ